jgi:hypothetical protein
MIIEVNMLLFILFCIFDIVMIYVIFNLYRKVDFLEGVLDRNYTALQNILTNMQQIDSTGHFEADDEVGTTFSALKEEINRLDSLIEEQNNAT